jgi:hypothetical protein
MSAELLSEDTVVIGSIVIGNIVYLDGVQVFDAKGEKLRYRATCLTNCQWCKQNTVAAPLQVMSRFEHSLGRRMYWHGIALSWEAIGALRCDECIRTMVLPDLDDEGLQ